MYQLNESWYQRFDWLKWVMRLNSVRHDSSVDWIHKRPDSNIDWIQSEMTPNLNWLGQTRLKNLRIELIQSDVTQTLTKFTWDMTQMWTHLSLWDMTRECTYREFTYHDSFESWLMWMSHIWLNSVPWLIWVMAHVNKSYLTEFSPSETILKNWRTERGGGLGSRPKKIYGERLGDGVEHHLMNPTPRR